MPTKEWLDQHTKVQAYLSTELSSKLDAWMRENKITQVSTAVVAILEHYLNDKPPEQISSQILASEVEALKEEVALIKASLIEAGAKSLAPKIPSEIIIAPSDRVEIEFTNSEAEAGLTKTELCERINLTLHQAEKVAKDQGLSINDYLLKVTGWEAGEGKRPKYYPASN